MRKTIKSDPRVPFGLPLDAEAWYNRVVRVHDDLPPSAKYLARVLRDGYSQGNTLHALDKLAQLTCVSHSYLRKLIQELSYRGIISVRLEDGPASQPRRTQFNAKWPDRPTQQETRHVA